MISNISPQWLSSLNSVIDLANTMAQARNPGFDLRNYLFDNLRDDIITYQKPPVADTLAAFASPPTIFLLAVADVDKAVDAIKTLASMGSPQDPANAPREFLGHKIYSIALRTPQVATGGNPPPQNLLYVSSAGGYLAISTQSTPIEEYLRSADGKGKSLREVSGIAEAASQVGGMGTGLFSFENQRETMRASFKLLKSANAGNPVMALVPPAFREWTDFSLLPDFDSVAKYFYISVFSSSANADGLTFKAFSPRPPQLN